MLRVHPLITTSDLPGAVRFLQALGLHRATGRVPDGVDAVLDAGSGRVSLRGCAPGSLERTVTSLAFDVSDVREFARRTAEAGTPVELREEGTVLTARITAPDGIPLLAGIGPRGTGAPPSPLTVLMLWHTSDAEPAVRVLHGIGARPGTSTDARRDFEAKNGGLVAVCAGKRTAVELAFEYDGDVRELVGGLTAAGAGPVTDGNRGRHLRVRAPWGAEVRIEGRQGPR